MKNYNTLTKHKTPKFIQENIFQIGNEEGRSYFDILKNRPYFSLKYQHTYTVLFIPHLSNR